MKPDLWLRWQGQGETRFRVPAPIGWFARLHHRIQFAVWRWKTMR